MMIQALRFSLLTLILAGCGDPQDEVSDAGEAGTGAFNGSVDGYSLAVADAFYDVWNSDSGQGLQVFLSSRPGSCALWQGNAEVGNVTAASFSFANYTNDGALLPLSAGTYAISSANSTLHSGKTADGWFVVKNATCQHLVDTGSTGGSATLNTFSVQPDGTARGTFSVVFGNTDSTSGSFFARRCVLPSGVRQGCQ